MVNRNDMASEIALDWLAIRLVPQVSRNHLHQLARRFGSPAYVFANTAADLHGQCRINQELCTQIVRAREVSYDEVKRELERMDRLGVRLLTEDDSEYPANLADSVSPPPLLYVRGTLEHERDRCCVAIIGARKATTYGTSVAALLGTRLAAQGIPIVSGFAQGIDSTAHRAALDANGRTIGVLGTGLGRCYPASNRPLGEEIVAKGGALISEYPMETRGEAYNFPERNCVIAAMSLGVLVTEARLKSGTLLTVSAAIDENRLVFAIPGDITRENSSGTNALIAEGAKLVQQATDITDDLADPLNRYLWKKPAEMSEKVSSAFAPTNKDEALDIVEQSLTAEERTVLGIVRHELCHIDVIRERAQDEGVPGRLLPGILLELELRDLIVQLPGKMYSPKI